MFFVAFFSKRYSSELSRFVSLKHVIFWFIIMYIGAKVVKIVLNILLRSEMKKS